MCYTESRGVDVRGHNLIDSVNQSTNTIKGEGILPITYIRPESNRSKQCDFLESI